MAGVSPNSVAGYVFYGTVTSGQSPFSKSGAFELHIAKVGDTYTIIGTKTVKSSAGLYEYEKTGPATADAILDDSLFGGSFSQDITFTSATTATYSIVAGGGFQKGTLKFTAPAATGSIKGTVFKDLNGDGKRAASEPVFPGVRVFIDKNGDGAFETTEKSIITNSSGQYSFTKLADGAYKICEVLPAQWRESNPAAGYFKESVIGGSAITNVNFNNTQRILISGTVFDDGNGNKTRDSGESALAGWRVYVDADNNGTYDPGEKNALTNSKGQWSFSTLASGSYVIRMDTMVGWARTTPTKGAGSYAVTLAKGATRTGLLFGARAVAASDLHFAAIDTANNDLYEFDTDHLGSPTLIGTVASGTDLYNLTAASSGNFYTFDRDANTIITISASNAAVVSSVALDQDVFVTRRGFDVSPGGVLYGVLPGMQLRTIDPATGVTTLVANVTGASRVEAIAFAPDGTLYASGSAGDDANSENLYQLNATTGVLSLVGTTGATDIDNLAFGSDGHLYGSDSVDTAAGHLYRLDTTTGVATDLGSTGVNGLDGLIAIP